MTGKTMRSFQPATFTAAQAAAKAWLVCLRRGGANRQLADALIQEFHGPRDEWQEVLKEVKLTSGFEHFVNAASVVYDL